MGSTRKKAISVFYNCPFDDGYKPMFEAVIFCVFAAGFQPRCSLEFDDATEIRIGKIMRIIGQCQYGIHDISYSKLDPSSGLPRFNMPFELGIFLGCKTFGGTAHQSKIGLVLDGERYQYHRSLSDISGMDIRHHGNDPRQAIQAVRDWLRVVSRKSDIPGGESIWKRYEQFRRALPRVCRVQKILPSELTFADYAEIASVWLREVRREASRPERGKLRVPGQRSSGA